ncbi:uncharacterized protein LAESUDRAFT_729694 [Laetiporus sulphureus 93-53]|uniref:Uncharacterized protein n=1 Tax=Laetiporus sulphureus 93-53 TaxID=1314785 RepID=A0A165CK26_9APHY|nr:uncharacterized protein LAESUDRAFT_729694 [Laetiporus sulphureus 93-53]KZT02954.1 hypothetical protein LAESUDRAFT_729694 [Laetiporus sulphureus 93-53]
MSSYGASPLPLSSGYASAAPLSMTPPVPKAHTHCRKPKPTKIFSSDGSFLERFQRLKKDEKEMKEQRDIVARKRTFDERFKKGDQRPPPDAQNSTAATEPPVKKSQMDTPTTQYQKEVKSHAGRSLKDDSIGV